MKKRRTKRLTPAKWMRRRERKIDRLRWKHQWVLWLRATDRLRHIHRERVEEERKSKKRLDAAEMARELLKQMNFHKGSNVLLLEGSQHMKEELDRLPISEVYHGLAGDKRSFGTYDFVVFGTITNPIRILQVYNDPFLVDGNGRKKFLKTGGPAPTRLAAIIDRDAAECGYKLHPSSETSAWMTFNDWLDKHHARSYDLLGHPKKKIVVIDRETL